MNHEQIRQTIRRLNPEVLIPLQIGALIGTRFLLDPLVSVSCMKPTQLLELLLRLKDLHIIQNSDFPKGHFSFCAEKYRDLILKTIEPDRKAEYLSKLIDYFEKELPEDPNNALVLSNLLLINSDHDNHILYTKKAADLLVSAHKTDDALILYRKVINALMENETDSIIKRVLFIESVIAYVPIAINIRPPDEIARILKKALSIARKLKNKRAEALIQLCFGHLYHKLGQNSKAARHSDRGWKLSAGINDEGPSKRASKLYALSLFWQGKISLAISVYEETLDNVEEISSDLRDQWTYLMLAYSYGVAGRIGRGIGLVEAIRERAVQRGDEKIQAFAYGILSMIFIEARKLEAAETVVQKAIEIGEKVDSDLLLFMTKPIKAYLEYSKGNFEDAIILIRSAQGHQNKVGSDISVPWIFEIYFALYKRNMPLSGHSLTSLKQLIEGTQSIYSRGAALRYYTLYLGSTGTDPREVEVLLKRSRELLKKAGAYIELGRTEIELARHYIGIGNMRQAQKAANAAFVNFSKTDVSLFPSEMKPLIRNQSKTDIRDHGITALGKAVHLLPDVNGYLSQVVTTVNDMFSAERTAILVANRQDSSGHLDVIASRNISPEDLLHFKSGRLQAFLRRTWQKNEPLIRAKPEEIKHNSFGIKSLVCVPFTSGTETAGILYMDNRLLDGIFSNQDFIIMKSIAIQLSFAFRTAELEKRLGDFENAFQETDVNSLEKDNASRRDPQLIGESAAIRDVMHLAEKVATSNATVLIHGETGVGKELVARAIHQLSHRKNRPFITVNISALNENLIPSELFGYAAGSFTGASSSRIGRFEAADGGTIFLDEIGEISLETQVKILRVIQEGQFERVGSNKTISSDFRLIVATNKDLNEKVARGEFRTDLFFRISNFPISVPALRERKEDIPLLVRYFLKKYAATSNGTVPKLTRTEMERLSAYSWPGNVRELEHVVEKALILMEGDRLKIPTLEHENSFNVKENTVAWKEGGFIPMAEMERRYLIDVLKHTRWKVRGKNAAAQITGLHPSTLDSRLKKLGIKK